MNSFPTISGARFVVLFEVQGGMFRLESGVCPKVYSACRTLWIEGHVSMTAFPSLHQLLWHLIIFDSHRVFEEYQTYRDADTGEREMDWATGDRERWWLLKTKACSALLHHLVSRKECSDSSSKLKLLFGCALLSTSEDYKTFLDFVLAMENKSTPQAERNETDSMDNFFSGNATRNALNCHKNQDCWPT